MGPSQIGFRRPNSKRVWSLQLRLQGRLQERDQRGWAAHKLRWAFIVLTGAPSQFNLYLQTWTEIVGLKRKVVFPALPLHPSPYPQRGWKRIRQRLSDGDNEKGGSPYLKSEWLTVRGSSMVSFLFFFFLHLPPEIPRERLSYIGPHLSKSAKWKIRLQTCPYPQRGQG